MSTEYEDGHPLYGRTDDEIASIAVDYIRDNVDASPEKRRSPWRGDIPALAHEYKRLKAEAEVRPCINARETYDELHRLKREVVDLGKEMGTYEPGWSSLGLNRLTFEFRRLKSISKDFDRQGFPISPWLTRAITLSVAPDDSDWAGLLEHVRELRLKEIRYDIMRPYTLEAHEIAGKHPGGGLVDSVRKLRERAESAESEVKRLRAHGEESSAVLDKHLSRAEAAEMALETKSDELGAMLSNAKQEVKVSRYRIKELESELETSNGYRTGISNDLDQVQLESNEFSRELNDVAGLLDESPARGVLVGPGIEDGVAFVVSKRLNRDSARIAELETRANSDAHLIAGVADYLVGNKAVEQAGNLAKMVDEHISRLKSDHKSTQVRIKYLEAENVRLEQNQLDATNAKWQAWVDAGSVPMTDTPTQTDLSRIAAALEKIANNG